MSEPERNLFMASQAMEQAVEPDDEAGRARCRHHLEFIAALANVMPLGARLWMSGWLAAIVLCPPYPSSTEK